MLEQRQNTENKDMFCEKKILAFPFYKFTLYWPCPMRKGWSALNIKYYYTIR